MNQLLAILIALLSFGLWGWFSKLSLFYLDATNALFYQTLGVLIIGLVTISFFDFKFNFHPKGMAYAGLTGLAYGIGCLFYLVAAGKGKVTPVVTLTALYPIITIILSFFLLNEPITLKQWCGIALALFAIFLLVS